jgi:hypothetical protein
MLRSMINFPLMKKALLTLSIVLTAVLTYAQAPSTFSYQAVVRDASNDLVISSTVGTRISILQGTSAVYVERHTPITNANGLISLQIGDGTLLSGAFASIEWGNGTYFIKTETDPTGGTAYTIAGTSQLLSVPYALYAENTGSSDSDWNISGNDIYSGVSGNVGIGTTSPGQRLDVRYSGALTTGNGTTTRSHIIHGNGSGTAEGVAIMGHAQTNSWNGTAEMIGVHGLGENLATGGNATYLEVIGVKGEALGAQYGFSKATGGYFTASGADDNFAILTENGEIRFSDLAGTGNRMVIANSDGDLSTQSIPSSTTYTLPTASASELGGVKVGTGLNISSGVLSSTYSYSLPTASSSQLGGVKVGAGLSISSGVLSSTYSYSLPAASASQLGGVKVGTGLSISSGVLSASGVADNLGNHIATQDIDLSDFSLNNVRNIYGKDYDDNSGGEYTGNTTRLLFRDNASMFYNGGVVIGSYSNDTWSGAGLSDGYLIVEGNAGIGTTNPQSRLDVTGASVIGYHGDNQRIYITPGDVTMQSNTSTNAWLEDAATSGCSCGGDGCASNGGSINIEYGDDVYILQHIPRGYQLVGWTLYFDNKPEHIVLREASVINSSTYLLHTVTPTSNTSNVSLSVSDYIPGGSDEYVSIQFENEDDGCNAGGNRVVFNGGYLKIAKCTSGCGL